MRIYLPATAADLRAPEVSVRGAHGVTPALQAAMPSADQEEWEFAAQMAAADDALRLVQAGGVPPVRVVIAADVEGAVADDDAEFASGVRLSGPVTWEDVACVFADEAAARGLVAGSEAPVDVELLWYDRTEIGALADSLLG